MLKVHYTILGGMGCGQSRCSLPGAPVQGKAPSAGSKGAGMCACQPSTTEKRWTGGGGCADEFVAGRWKLSSARL